MVKTIKQVMLVFIGQLDPAEYCQMSTICDRVSISFQKFPENLLLDRQKFQEEFSILHFFFLGGGG